MKEKIAVIIILTSVLALLFHHQSHDNSTQLTSIEEDISTCTKVSFPPLKVVEGGLVLPLEKLVKIDDCKLNPATTDNLAFKDAFIHFRKCLGSNQEFLWKGKSYLTILAEEVEDVKVLASDTMVVKVNENNTEIVTR